ncbi:FAD-binding oxidoreductase [Sphaerisporangium album]|uniref:FAD-binding oxidoreductase n=1 Tax=Sphaerisporangium album TaxID=509200 RepID=UPI001C68AA3B|nr:FAD-binding oxidoreductase [Sphaerisporangium album]
MDTTDHRRSWLGPGDPGYDAARAVWNGLYDRRPAFVARCRTAADVSAALRHAADESLEVTVRGGGHGVAGTAVADGTLLIDLSPMRAVTVDPVARVAHAAGGCLVGDVDAATAPHGLACPLGAAPRTGLGGLALGGGYGWLARRWGLTCDHIEAAEVVLADGSIVEATEDRHPDLLWALRGGGGNFGVVTRFTLRLRPVGPVHHQVAVYPMKEAAAALAAYRAFAGHQPRDLRTVGSFRHAGRQEWIPARLRGAPALFLTAAWSGDPADGPAATTPLFGTAPPAGVLARVMSHADLQALGDGGEPSGHRYFVRSSYLDDLPPGAAVRFTDAVREMPSPLSSIGFEYLRGAVTDVPDEDSAFPRRDAAYMCTVSAQWTAPGGDAENIAWARRAADRVKPFATRGGYVNHLQDVREGKVLEVYGTARHRRLAVVKKAYDPGNVLRHNHNIPPAADR